VALLNRHGCQCTLIAIVMPTMFLNAVNGGILIGPCQNAKPCSRHPEENLENS